MPKRQEVLTWEDVNALMDHLLPQIPAHALIILDNAPYHNGLSAHSAPTPTGSKDHIRTWLEANNIPCRDDCLKVELVEMLNKLAPPPTYVIDELVVLQKCWCSMF